MTTPTLTWEEKQTLMKIENYFKHPDMSLHDKIFNALVIAEHELIDHCFANENERLRIEKFKDILNDLLPKISIDE